MASRQQFIAACRAVGVGVSGTKDDLLDRLLENETVAACIGRIAKRKSKATCVKNKTCIAKKKVETTTYRGSNVPHGIQEGIIN